MLNSFINEIKYVIILINKTFYYFIADNTILSVIIFAINSISAQLAYSSMAFVAMPAKPL